MRFRGGLTAAQRAAFETAAGRWGQIITADVPAVVIGGQTIDDVRIDAEGVRIDDAGMILGQAGPLELRPGSFIPATGVMSFDTGAAPLEGLENGLFWGFSGRVIVWSCAFRDGQERGSGSSGLLDRARSVALRAGGHKTGVEGRRCLPTSTTRRWQRDRRVRHPLW